MENTGAFQEIETAMKKAKDRLGNRGSWTRLQIANGRFRHSCIKS